jgi:Uncharacterized protein conserved in bacteria (DUF2252)
MMLGWSVGRLEGRHFYLRLLRDMKLGAMLETFDPETLNVYGKVCGWALARAHARSGDPAMISGYLGNSDVSIMRLSILHRHMPIRRRVIIMRCGKPHATAVSMSLSSNS